MGVITIRLDEELENLLNQEIQLADKSRSDLVREALEQYLAYRNQERLKQTLVQEMKNLPDEAKREGLAVSEDFLPYSTPNPAGSSIEPAQPSPGPRLDVSGQAVHEKNAPWWK